MRTAVIFSLTPEALELLKKLAEARQERPEEVLESEIRRAAVEAGLLPVPDAAEDAALVLEAVEEIPAIGPGGRGRRVRLKTVDEAGEQDLGEFFVTDEKD